MSVLVDLLVRRCPPWASVEVKGTELDVTAEVRLPSGKIDAPVFLHVWETGARLWVRENEPRQWPVCCPERHIESSGTFCLGVGDPIRPTTDTNADTWWDWLKEFILSQRVAQKTGLWPSSRTLHHGDAYKHQLRLEKISKGTIFETAVRNLLEEGAGWLSGDLLKFRGGDRCPCKCVRRGRHLKLRNCQNRALVRSLVKEEAARRREEQRFWSYFSGRTCCETMRNCPLREGNNNGAQ